MNKTEKLSNNITFLQFYYVMIQHCKKLFALINFSMIHFVSETGSLYAALVSLEPCVNQASLKLRGLHALASQILELKACDTMTVPFVLSFRSRNLKNITTIILPEKQPSNWNKFSLALI